MITFTKGESVKFIDEGSSLIPLLKLDGWKAEGEAEDVFEADIEELRAEAEALGIKVHHKAGVSKIVELIKEAKGE
jgi:hypothetical protein